MSDERTTFVPIQQPQQPPPPPPYEPPVRRSNPDKKSPNPFIRSVDMFKDGPHKQ